MLKFKGQLQYHISERILYLLRKVPNCSKIALAIFQYPWMERIQFDTIYLFKTFNNLENGLNLNFL